MCMYVYTLTDASMYTCTLWTDCTYSPSALTSLTSTLPSPLSPLPSPLSAPLSPLSPLATGGWYTGESGSDGTIACNGNHSPLNRTAAGTPSDHTSSYNGAVCDYCRGMCQECTCENSAQVRSCAFSQHINRTCVVQ